MVEEVRQTASEEETCEIHHTVSKGGTGIQRNNHAKHYLNSLELVSKLI